MEEDFSLGVGSGAGGKDLFLVEPLWLCITLPIILLLWLWLQGLKRNFSMKRPSLRKVNSNYPWNKFSAIAFSNIHIVILTCTHGDGIKRQKESSNLFHYFSLIFANLLIFFLFSLLFSPDVSQTSCGLYRYVLQSFLQPWRKYNIKVSLNEPQLLTSRKQLYLNASYTQSAKLENFTFKF